jgi:hypothetical protein
MCGGIRIFCAVGFLKKLFSALALEAVSVVARLVRKLFVQSGKV